MKSEEAFQAVLNYQSENLNMTASSSGCEKPSEGVKIFTSKRFQTYIEEIRGLTPEILNYDEQLNIRMKKKLGTAIHMAGTAKMRTDPDAGAVVDQ